MLLIPKGNIYTWEIGLFEVVWKVVESVIDTRIKTVVQFKDVLHGFRAGIRTRNAIMEFKPDEELASVDEDPFFLILLDLRKAYKNQERWRLLQTLEGYREYPKL